MSRHRASDVVPPANRPQPTPLQTGVVVHDTEVARRQLPPVPPVVTR